MDGMSFSSLSLLPAAVMGAAAPWAPPKGRQTRGEKDMKFNQTSSAANSKDSEIKPINLNDFVELM